MTRIVLIVAVLAILLGGGGLAALSDGVGGAREAVEDVRDAFTDDRNRQGRRADRQGRRQGPRADLGSPTALTRLRTATIAADGTYERDRFGTDWADLDDDGCNTREETLARDLTDVEYAADGCNVEAGTLADPYTGRTITFVEDEDPAAVQIDHVYALSRAWNAGASGWTDARRLAFANDPRNLLAVDGPTNASKGDQGPETWLPLARSQVCAYARRYTQVAYAYRLPITPADRDSLRLALGTC